jgi:hypothetical protein
VGSRNPPCRGMSFDSAAGILTPNPKLCRRIRPSVDTCRRFVFMECGGLPPLSYGEARLASEEQCLLLLRVFCCSRWHRHSCLCAFDYIQLRPAYQPRACAAPCPHFQFSIFDFLFLGAEEGTRTPTAFRPPAPKAGASANSATSARWPKYNIAGDAIPHSRAPFCVRTIPNALAAPCRIC